MNPADPADAIAHLAPKLRPILRRAKELGAFINFDMESYAHKNATLELFRIAFSPSRSFRDWPHAGIVIQAYLRDAEEDLSDLIAWGRERGTRFTVRLVKGAYWDYEKIKSTQNGWVIPVWLQKPESDANFERLTRILLENESIVTSRVWFTQCPQHRACAGVGGRTRNQSQPFRVSVALRNGRPDQARAGRDWVIASANIHQSANYYCRECRTWCAVSLKIPPTKDSCARSSPSMFQQPNCCVIHAIW